MRFVSFNSFGVEIKLKDLFLENQFVELQMNCRPNQGTICLLKRPISRSRLVSSNLSA